MTAPISLSALRAAHEAATPGEWEHDGAVPISDTVRDGVDQGATIERRADGDVVVLGGQADAMPKAAVGVILTADAAAIVAAHNALPALLAVVEAALGWADDVVAEHVLRDTLARFVR